MLSSLSLNLAVLLGPPDGEDEPRLAVVQVPGRLPRLVRPPGVEGMLLRAARGRDPGRAREPVPGPEDPRRRPPSASRATPSSSFDDEGGRDFLQAIEEELRKRRRSGIVRLEIEDGVVAAAARAADRRGSSSGPDDVYRIRGPLDIRRADVARGPAAARGPARPAAEAAAVDRAERRTSSRCSTSATCCCTIPYESFDPVVALVSVPRPTTPTCSRSSRRSTARAATRPWCARSRGPPRTASRSRCSSS